MEKHWKSVVNRSVCDYFFEAQAKASTPGDVPPVIPTPHYYLISVFRNNMYFVAVTQSEGEGVGVAIRVEGCGSHAALMVRGVAVTVQ